MSPTYTKDPFTKTQITKTWVGGKNHKESCQCKTCLRARDRHKRSLERIASGLLPKEKGLTEKETILVDALATQAVTSGKLDKKAAGEVAGYLESSVSEKLGENRIRQAFRRTLHAKGVTQEKIAETIAAGLNANDIKVLSKDGVCTGKVEVPNWLARHKFVETGAKALQLIEDRKEEQKPVGVFNLIAPVIQVPGHEPGCRCDKCEAVRQRAREKLLARENYIPEEFRVIDVAPSDDPFDKEKK